MKNRVKTAVLATGVAGLSIVGLTGASFASQSLLSASAERESTTEVAMIVTGFDEKVAEANGYRVVIGKDGLPTSIPVSASAQVDEAKARELAAKAGRSSASGNCGTASLTTKPIASQGRIAIATSYSLSNGRKSFGHLWKVSGQSRLGTPFTESFSGANNFDGSWNATHSISLYGYSHGTNSLNLTNHAKLTNGGICTAKVVINSW